VVELDVDILVGNEIFFEFVCKLEKDLVLDVVGKVFELANKFLPLDVDDHDVGVTQVAKTLIQMLDEKKVLMLGL